MAAQGRRIEASCRIIWGPGDYDLDEQTDDYTTYYCTVRRDFGHRFGLTLTMTGICNSSDQAWNELDRMLSVWARVMQSRREMTREERLEIFGGPNGRDRAILEISWNEVEGNRS